MRKAAIALIALVLLGTALARCNALLYPTYLKYAFWQTAVLILFVLLAAHTRARPPARFVRGALTTHLPQVLLAAFLVLCLISPLWSGVADISFQGALLIACGVAWALLVACFVRTPAEVRTLTILVVIAGALAAAQAAVEGLRGTHDYVAQIIGHRNFLGAFLLTPILLAACRLERSLRRRASAADALQIAGLLLALGLMLWAMCVVMGIGAWLGLAVGAATLWLFRANFHRRFCALVVLVGVLVAAAVALGAWPGLTKRLAERLLHTHQAARVFFTIGSVRMIAARPLLGWGTGMFLCRWPQFRPTEAGRYGWLMDVSLHPHNEYLNVAIEVGALGLALYLCAILLIAVRAGRGATGNHSDARWTTVPLIAGLCAMLTQGAFTVVLRFWGGGVMFWTVIGLLLRIGSPRPSAETARSPGPRRAAWIRAAAAALLAAPIFGWVVCRGVVAELHLRRARDAMLAGLRAKAAGADAERTEHLRKAASLYGQGARRSTYHVTSVIARGKLGTCLWKLGDLDGAIRTLEDLQEIAPGLWESQLILGRLYLRRGRPGDAVHAAQHLLDYVGLRPYDPRVLAPLRSALGAPGARSLPRGVAYLRGYVKRSPEDAGAQFLLGLGLAESGNPQQASLWLNRSIALGENDLRSELEDLLAATVACRPGRAGRAGRRASQAAQQLSSAYLVRARVELQLGRSAAARRSLGAALRSWPGNPEARAELKRLPSEE